MKNTVTLYNNRINLIRSLAIKYSRSNPRWDYEELMGEGALVFVQCTKSFNARRKVSFNTYLYTCLKNHFIDLLTKRRCCNTFLPLPPSREIESKPKATSIMNLIPKDTLRLVRIIAEEEPRNKKALHTILRNKGWKHQQIKDHFRAIKAVVRGGGK